MMGKVNIIAIMMMIVMIHKMTKIFLTATIADMLRILMNYNDNGKYDHNDIISYRIISYWGGIHTIL